MNLTENETVKYRVKYQDNILLDSVSLGVAENFVSTLTKPVQEQVEIIPITNNGMQVLFG